LETVGRGEGAGGSAWVSSAASLPAIHEKGGLGSRLGVQDWKALAAEGALGKSSWLTL
jgi:hypothetical protein